MGAILLAHTAMEGMPVTDEVMLETRIDPARIEPYEIVRINPCTRPRDGFDERLDWEELAERQEELYARELRPIMEAHPSWPVVYFGLVPIPLASTNHDNRNWSWPRSSRTWCFARRPWRVPRVQSFYGSVAIRVATSYRIAPSQTQAVAKTSFAYDVRSRSIYPDSIRSELDLEAIVRAL